jgi:hypothetical protein
VNRTWPSPSFKAYYGLLWAEQYRDNILETQHQRKLHWEMARTRFQNGVATSVDVLRSEVAVAVVTLLDDTNRFLVGLAFRTRRAVGPQQDYGGIGCQAAQGRQKAREPQDGRIAMLRIISAVRTIG